MDSFKNYKDELRSRYESVKFGPHSHFLINPSQGNLRDLCIIACSDRKPADLHIFKSFLGFDYDESAINRIRRSREKFRSLTNFLKGQSDLSDVTAADMLAMLIDYQNRPFAAFIQTGNKVIPSRPAKSTAIENDVGATKGRMRKWAAALIGISVIGLVILSSIGILRPQCLQWNVDRYSEVDCNTTGKLIGYDSKLLSYRKIAVGPETIFFIGGKPQVWYAKHDGNVEYFNMPGRHPITGKKLQPVSVYMARKIRGAIE